jgi:hypothetical protein
MSISFTVLSASGAPVEGIEFEPHRVILGGYSARSAEERERHIEELRQIGIEPPARVPAFWPVSRWLLTTAGEIEVQGEKTSGEVEYALIAHQGTTFVAVASDQTDRHFEQYSIPRSKQLCPKVLSEEIVPLADVIDRWDGIVISSQVSADGQTWHDYQRTTLGALLDPDALVRAACGSQPLADGTVLLSGTVPIVDGVTRYLPHFRAELAAPALVSPLRLAYTVAILPDGLSEGVAVKA